MHVSQSSVGLSSLLRISHDDLIKKELSKDVFTESILLEFEVIEFDFLSFNNLIIIDGIIDILEEWVLKYLSGSKSFRWIPLHELADKVKCCIRCIWKQVSP